MNHINEELVLIRRNEKAAAKERKNEKETMNGEDANKPEKETDK
jgi:hypothetical protein